jgi:hypothetical protein
MYKSLIKTKLTIISRIKQLNTKKEQKPVALKIQVLALDNHENVASLS